MISFPSLYPFVGSLPSLPPTYQPSRPVQSAPRAASNQAAVSPARTQGGAEAARLVHGGLAHTHGGKHTGLLACTAWPHHLPAPSPAQLSIHPHPFVRRVLSLLSLCGRCPVPTFRSALAPPALESARSQHHRPVQQPRRHHQQQWWWWQQHK